MGGGETVEKVRNPHGTLQEGRQTFGTTKKKTNIPDFQRGTYLWFYAQD